MPRVAVEFAKGSVESTHKVPTSHYHAKHRLAKRSALNDTRKRARPLPHETLPRSGRVARWTNSPAGADEVRQSAACARQL